MSVIGKHIVDIEKRVHCVVISLTIVLDVRIWRSRFSGWRQTISEAWEKLGDKNGGCYFSQG